MFFFWDLMGILMGYYDIMVFFLGSNGIFIGIWLVVYLPLWKNMKVKWDDYSQDMEKTNVPNHQSDFKHGVMCLAVLPPGSPQRRREACACPVPVAFQRASAHPLDKYPNLSWAAYAIFSSIFPKKMLGQFTSIPSLLSEILYLKKKNALRVIPPRSIILT